MDTSQDGRRYNRRHLSDITFIGTATASAVAPGSINKTSWLTMKQIGIRRLFSCLLLLLVSSYYAGTACAEVLIVPGSGNNEFVLGEIAKVFNSRQNLHQVVVPPSSGTAGAVRDVSEGITALGRSGRPLREAELAKGLTYLPLGREAVVVVAGSAVTVRHISTEQLKGVFSGKITQWSELGGKSAPIRAITKESTDAIRSQLTAYLKDITYADTIRIAHFDTQLLELLDRYPTSLAIMNRSALGACKTKVVTLALDGVEPSSENVATGRYPLVMEYGLIHKTGTLSPASKALIDFIRSPDGVAILRQHGVLPKTTGI